MRLFIHVGIVLALLPRITTASLASLNINATELESLSRELPKCAWNCWAPLVSGSKCDLDDAACLCTDLDFHKTASACVQTECSAQDSLTATRIQKEACGFSVRDRSNITLVTTWSLFGLTVIAVTLRFLARASVMGGKGYGWDDWTILLCLIVLIPQNILLTIMLDLGLGKDMWMLEPPQITGVLFWFWVEEYLYSALVLLTKISILLLYLRLFPETERWFRPTCLVLIGATAITAIPVYITILFQCRPVAYAWYVALLPMLTLLMRYMLSFHHEDRHKWDALQTGSCIDTVAQIATLAAVNMILDIIIILLPVPRLLKLNISLGKKIGVVAIFTVGLFVTITSAVRLQYVVHWGESQNPTWQYNPLALWSIIECNFTVICACMPPLAGPIKRVFKGTIAKRLFSSDSEVAPRRRPSILPFRDVKKIFKNDLGAKPKLPTFVTVQRRYESTDELELVDRNLDQQSMVLHGT